MEVNMSLFGLIDDILTIPRVITKPIAEASKALVEELTGCDLDKEND